MTFLSRYRQWRDRRRALSLLGQWLSPPPPPSRKDLLRCAQESLASLRKGEQTSHWVERYIKEIERAIEAGWSHDGIGTSHNEMMSFRRDESQKIQCRKWVESFRQTPTDDWLVPNILSLAQEVGFPTEEIGMSRKEAASIIREKDRRICAS